MAVPRLSGTFGCHDEPVTLAFSQEPTVFRAPRGGTTAAEWIDVSRVEKVDATFRGRIEDRMTARFIALAAECHRAEAETGDTKTCATQSNMLHWYCSEVMVEAWQRQIMRAYSLFSSGHSDQQRTIETTKRQCCGTRPLC
jgi:hypothetical protein